MILPYDTRVVPNLSHLALISHLFTFHLHPHVLSQSPVENIPIPLFYFYRTAYVIMIDHYGPSMQIVAKNEDPLSTQCPPCNTVVCAKFTRSKIAAGMMTPTNGPL